MIASRLVRPLFAIATILIVSCGGDTAVPSPEGDDDSPAAAAASDAKLTGTIIEITMHTDEKGNYFSPSEIEAHEGDVLRFKLVTGVHNVNFLPDSNPGKTGLPPVSMYLQLPGQTLDIPLTFGEGDFYFHCDPHAMLGMVARLEVEDN